jgi:nucleoside-diphosphate-sugar epimerase
MKRIFMTGASGCIGHYLTENLIKETDYELFLLIRNPDKLKVNITNNPHIHIIKGNLGNIEDHGELLKTINVAILVATAWGDPKETYNINVTKNLQLMELLNPEICEQIIYFSTASILGNDNNLLKEAGEIGTDYISTKYECFNRLSSLQIASKITTVFPTLVFGGDKNKPYSHISGGLADVVKWVSLVRWLKADGSFHFIHGEDIAKVVVHLIKNPPVEDKQNPLSKERLFVLGNEPLTADQAIHELCNYFKKKIYFQIPLSVGLANFFIKVFNIQMAEWDRFCLNYRHFTYEKYFRPSTFGLEDYCPTITSLLKEIGL